MKDKTKKIICIRLEKLSKSYESSLETEKKTAMHQHFCFMEGKGLMYKDTPHFLLSTQ